MSMQPGDKIKWVGNPNLNCAPGLTGTVLSIADKDPNQIKVVWDPVIVGDREYRRRKGMEYTWERRKNITHDN